MFTSATVCAQCDCRDAVTARCAECGVLNSRSPRAQTPRHLSSTRMTTPSPKAWPGAPARPDALARATAQGHQADDEHVLLPDQVEGAQQVGTVDLSNIIMQICRIDTPWKQSRKMTLSLPKYHSTSRLRQTPRQMKACAQSGTRSRPQDRSSSWPSAACSSRNRWCSTVICSPWEYYSAHQSVHQQRVQTPTKSVDLPHHPKQRQAHGRAHFPEQHRVVPVSRQTEVRSRAPTAPDPLRVDHELSQAQVDR